jgi:hypothetical protein
MNERVKRLTDEIRNLPPEDQAELLDELLVLTHREPDPEIEKAWAAEIEKRISAVERGEVELFDADEVLTEARERLRKK